MFWHIDVTIVVDYIGGLALLVYIASSLGPPVTFQCCMLKGRRGPGTRRHACDPKDGSKYRNDLIEGGHAGSNANSLPTSPSIPRYDYAI